MTGKTSAEVRAAPPLTPTLSRMREREGPGPNRVDG
jgi:hypothetical protein